MKSSTLRVADIITSLRGLPFYRMHECTSGIIYVYIALSIAGFKEKESDTIQHNGTILYY